MANNNSWEAIFKKYRLFEHDFSAEAKIITASEIKSACQDFKKTSEKEVRILCKQDSREDVPKVMAERGLFLLPVKNGKYVILQGEGYMDIPDIHSPVEVHRSSLNFRLETSAVGNSEMQHLDHAYATSIIRTFIGDNTLVLTVRGRKYCGNFSFNVGGQEIAVASVQTEVDAGYEGENQIVLVEAKNSKTKNTIIRQLFYPYRQWSMEVSKKVRLVFFEKRRDTYMLWEYKFNNPNDYNSIELAQSKAYRLDAP